MSWFKNLSIDDLVARLQKANWAYRNTGTPLMSDDEYDRGFEELRRRSPQHPFLKVVGSPDSGTVLLPYVMGSLNKIRAGEGTLERFIRRMGGAGGVTVSDKLDGLSALLVLRSGAQPLLYLQGDGVRGVDVSRTARMIKGCAKLGLNAIVRGELVLPLSATPAGSIGRSLVNGWMHRALDSGRPVPEELRDVHFVAYATYEPAGMRRDEQFEWLRSAGFEIPWFQHWVLVEATEARALAVLKERRQESPYPLDGIVMGSATVPEVLGGGEDKNPSDAIAFKASLDDQKAETTVVQIEWNTSRTGALIPRIQIEPVEIGGATIQWLSGHNAKAIVEGRLGPGARIIVRRSGDVIPTLDEVLEGAAGGAALPPAGTWDWDETKTHALARGDAEAAAPALLHALQTLGVAGIGPGLVQKLVDGGLRTLRAVRDAPAAKLAELLGAGRGPTFRSGLEEALARAQPIDLLIASNCLPRGCGERKLRGLFEVEPNYRKWTSARFGCTAPAGWSVGSIADFWDPFGRACKWIEDNVGPQAHAMPEQPRELSVNGVIHPVAERPPPAARGGVCFSNCRDKALEGRLPAAGYELHESVSKKTSVLVVPDGNARETTKVTKARALGVRIVALSEFAKEI